jgi:hypothetical protein
MLEINTKYQTGGGQFIGAAPHENNEGENGVVTAFVDTSKPNEINFTKYHWISGQSTTQVLNHEMSHFTGTKDGLYCYKSENPVYGKKESQAMAKECPQEAYRHADSVAIWIEDQ